MDLIRIKICIVHYPGQGGHRPRFVDGHVYGHAFHGASRSGPSDVIFGPAARSVQ